MSYRATPPSRTNPGDPRSGASISRLAAGLRIVEKKLEARVAEPVKDPVDASDDHRALLGLLRALREAGLILP